MGLSWSLLLISVQPFWWQAEGGREGQGTDWKGEGCRRMADNEGGESRKGKEAEERMIRMRRRRSGEGRER